MGDTDYNQYKSAALDGLTTSERELYDQAYESAGVAMDLAAIAYRARATAGLTQKELAERMGTAQSSIAAVENGARPHGQLPRAPRASLRCTADHQYRLRLTTRLSSDTA